MFSSPSILRTAALSLALLIPSVTPAGEPVSYPEGYRTWTHVKTLTLHEGHPLYGSFGGIHHIYANKQAMKGYRSGSFPDGAVIAFDLYEAVTQDKATGNGTNKVLGVMSRDRERFAATGGWGFEGFAGGDSEKPLVKDKAAGACFGCHQLQAAPDFVFSEYSD